MNNSRNFTNEISNKNSFVSLKDEINKKIKETLFDQNLLFLSSSFNDFCSSYNGGNLLDEAKNISNLIDNLPGIEEEKIENISLPPCNSGKPMEGTDMEDGSDSKKKFIESEEEKSSSFGSKFSKFSQVEENKQKLNICLVKFPELIKLLNVKNGANENNDLDINNNNNENDNCDEKIRSKITQMENDIQNNKNIEIKNRYLRKMVCLKLYKALHFALKNFALDEEQINNFRERIDEFTKEELDKELAFVLVQSKSTIFTHDDSGFIPKDEPTLTGINAILEKQKNKKK